MYNKTTKIISANLSLLWYYPSSPRNQSTAVEIYRPLDWNQSFVSWNRMTSSTPWSSPCGDWLDMNNASQGSAPFASVTFNAAALPDNRYYDFNVTELLRRYISGAYNNTGFFLKARNENDNYIAFYSSESNAGQRPRLVIESYDTNGDGAVNVLDSYSIVSHLGESYSGQQYQVYDVNSDGIVNTTDIDLVGVHLDR